MPHGTAALIDSCRCAGDPGRPAWARPGACTGVRLEAGGVHRRDLRRVKPRVHCRGIPDAYPRAARLAHGHGEVNPRRSVRVAVLVELGHFQLMHAAVLELAREDVDSDPKGLAARVRGGALERFVL